MQHRSILRLDALPNTTTDLFGIRTLNSMTIGNDLIHQATAAPLYQPVRYNQNISVQPIRVRQNILANTDSTTIPQPTRQHYNIRAYQRALPYPSLPNSTTIPQPTRQHYNTPSLPDSTTISEHTRYHYHTPAYQIALQYPSLPDSTTRSQPTRQHYNIPAYQITQKCFSQYCHTMQLKHVM